MSARIHVNQVVSRVRSGLADMSYAQRRVFENRTGVAITGHDRRHGSPGRGRDPVIPTSTDQLEALYAQDVKTGWR